MAYFSKGNEVKSGRFVQVQETTMVGSCGGLTAWPEVILKPEASVLAEFQLQCVELHHARA
jgi:hypothetical protein